MFGWGGVLHADFVVVGSVVDVGGCVCGFLGLSPLVGGVAAVEFCV